jgi:two-component system, NtrC family, sensor kinase
VFSRWPMKHKLLLGLGGLCAIVLLLAGIILSAAYTYKDLAKTLSHRAAEGPLAIDLLTHVGDLRVTLSRAHGEPGFPADRAMGRDLSRLQNDFREDLGRVRNVLSRYREQLDSTMATDPRLRDNHGERETLAKIDQALARIDRLNRPEVWTDDRLNVDALGTELETLEYLAAELPSHLQRRMQNFTGEVRGLYRSWIGFSLAASAGAGLIFGLVTLAIYRWVITPLNVLTEGARRVAKNDFQHRVAITSHDEMGELANAMNAMIANFQQTRDELDQQVRERTAEVVRSERLAGVGFLAAGVAHEINNPMASIAWAAEAMEQRLAELFGEQAEGEGSPDVEILCKYARRIQTEAFRCKGITERLLDFSRMGDVEKHATDLSELIDDVVAMVRIGKYKEKRIDFHREAAVVAPVNEQEIKQVMLNLITNSLDSLEPGGTVWVDLQQTGDAAEISVADNGCGMSPEVLKHLYEPFFTRRRDGSGTGLGLSITHRIVVDDHGGRIEAHSDGPGCGSRFKVTLPLTPTTKDHEKRRQAA